MFQIFKPWIRLSSSWIDRCTFHILIFSLHGSSSHQTWRRDIIITCTCVSPSTALCVACLIAPIGASRSLISSTVLIILLVIVWIVVLLLSLKFLLAAKHFRNFWAVSSRINAIYWYDFGTEIKKLKKRWDRTSKWEMFLKNFGFQIFGLFSTFLIQQFIPQTACISHTDIL